MTEEHHRISEILAPYQRGELGAPENAEVEKHLASCEGCRSELAAVRALFGAPVPAMEEIERARLHRAVLSGTKGGRAIAPGPSLARVASALGAAALFALFAFGAAQLFTGGLSGSGESATGGGADSDSGAGAPEAATVPSGYQDGVLGLPASHPRLSSGAADGRNGDGGAGGQSSNASSSAESGDEPAATEIAASEGPPPYFEPQPRVLSEQALHRLGRTRDPFAAFSLAYRAGDGVDRRGQTTALSLASPEPGEVRACADRVMAQDRNAVPAYGALGTFEGRYAIALGFVTAPRASGALSRYDIWVWDFGDCSSAVDGLSPIARLRGRI